ncbi:hypothetical protein FO519_001350 [Halicephalobus sp. NKZ332]|nr:hypothetical protein FO519_001350 [Halicephalobus sp. NKZ332]
MASNVTLNTLIIVPPDYVPDAIWNLSGCIWGWIPNIFILVVGICGNVKGRFKYAIIGMSACQLYATITQTILYITYIYVELHQVQMTVLTCSVPRRIFQQTMNVALLSLLMISLDRYLAILWSKHLTKTSLVFIFLLPAFYAHGIYNTLTLIPMQLGTSDMCGPCIKMPEAISYYLEPIPPICLALAIIINIRILWFLFRYDKNRKSKNTAAVYTKKELQDMKQAMIGVMLQACIPMLFNMPQVINLAMYNVEAQLRMSKDAWRVINGLNYFTLFLNPCVTLLFVKQFRIAALSFIGKHEVSSTVEASVRSAAKSKIQSVMVFSTTTTSATSRF